MYSQFQRFIATVLLFSILLQSCGNPNCKMAEPSLASTSSKMSSLEHCTPPALVRTQQNDSEHATELVVPKADQLSEELAEVVSEVLHASPVTSFHAAHDRDRSSAPSPTSACSPGAPVSVDLLSLPISPADLRLV
jgi:hypothetical protein